MHDIPQEAILLQVASEFDYILADLWCHCGVIAKCNWDGFSTKPFLVLDQVSATWLYWQLTLDKLYTCYTVETI